MFFFQPSIISTLVNIMTCRKIGDKNYVLADLTYECYTEEHTNYVFNLAVPFLLLWGIVYPIYFSF